MRLLSFSSAMFVLFLSFLTYAQSLPTTHPIKTTRPAKMLSPAAVVDQVRAHQDKLDRCAEQFSLELKRVSGASPSNHLLTRFTVENSGKVTRISLVRSSGNTAVDRCVIGVVRQFHFKAIDHDTVIEHPLLIQAKVKLSRLVKGLNSGSNRVKNNNRLEALPRDVDANILLFKDHGMSLHFGGLLQIQGAFYAGDEVAREFGDPVDTEGFRIRRARLSFSGRLNREFSYFISLDLKDAVGANNNGDAGNELLDARILWDRFDWLHISAGVDRVAFSAFTLESSARLSLIERPLSSDILAPGRRVGLSVLGKIDRFTYALGIYNGSDGVTTGNQFAGVALSSRLTASLFDFRQSFVPERFQATVGGALMYDNQAAVDITRFAGSLELSFLKTRLLSEYIYEKSTPDEQPMATPDAGEVSRWSLASELSVFVWRDMIQLAARYEYFDDNEDLPTFGKQQLIGGGVNIYFKEHAMKLQINYLRRDELEGPEVENDMGLAQLQASF